ncbi:MAG: heme anaerobic degradation radical SAM methyltransferase ChuW/HutW [Puniceicoccaceae bacterium]
MSPVLMSSANTAWECAFPARAPLMPRMGGRRLESGGEEALWRKEAAERRTGKTVAYVHVPFCSNRCLFCNFYRNPTRSPYLDDYGDLVAREIENDAREGAIGSGRIHAVYLGGGTPTDLDARSLAAVLEALRRHLPLANDCEITVEGRIWGFGEDKIEACLDHGANRFSLGIQSFDTALRRAMGRKLDRREVETFFREFTRRDAAAVVCDLIYGLPGQTEESWLRDVEILAGLGLDGADLYCYTKLADSPLARAIESGRMCAEAPVHQQARWFVAAAGFLTRAGWRHISSAHFAATTRERNLYNQLTKAGAQGLAFGAGAAGGTRSYNFVNAPSLEAYAQAVGSGRKPIAFLAAAPATERTRTAITAGIESGRLDLHSLSGFEPAHRDAAAELARKWEAGGLLDFDGRVLRLTPAGRFWHTNLTTALLALLDPAEPSSGAPHHHHRSRMTA